MKSVKIISDNLLTILTNHAPLLLITHDNPDGDAIGAIFGLKKFLDSYFINSQVLLKTKIPNIYQSLVKNDDYLLLEKFNNLSNYRGLVVLDSANLSRTLLKDLTASLAQLPILNIDHHISNELFGDYNWVDSEWSSTCEGLVFLLNQEVNIQEEAARFFLVGILTDTGYLSFPSTRIPTIESVAYLYQQGVSIFEIVRLVKENMHKNQFKLWGYAMFNLQFDDQFGIIWSVIPNKFYREHQIAESDSEGLVEFFKRYHNCKLAILFKETETGVIRVSLRSKGQIDSNNLAAVWNGGGHPQAAGFTVKGELFESVQNILDIIRRKITLWNH